MTSRRWLVSVSTYGGVLKISEDATVVSHVTGLPAPDGWAWLTTEEVSYLEARLQSVPPHVVLKGLEGPTTCPAYFPIPDAWRELST